MSDRTLCFCTAALCFTLAVTLTPVARTASLVNQCYDAWMERWGEKHDREFAFEHRASFCGG